MAKTAVPVDRVVLTDCIKEIEASESFSSLPSLHIKVANMYNMKMNPARELTKSVVALRIKEFGIPTITTKGKRGRKPKMVIADQPF